MIDATGHDVAVSYVLNGKAALDRSLKGYNSAARFAPWLVLRDLDHDADCAPTLIEHVLPAPAEKMLLRIAVRAVEAWLMADAERLAAFISVPLQAIPEAPETVDDPKAVVATLHCGPAQGRFERTWHPRRAPRAVLARRILRA